ncbi:conserved hypothetical protein [Tsukamurella paurometabola DSM 20162]|uniref:Uncharacterized protein n=1 Tax=Tsukamurella paurometabola (strain ATCC 8368 / DSM 20162 / CCUG 35730 / CIP 100753 / JCM 10117 / KCTC 9821 / NBRC 16120 / NCIMB 702349 / NCTC 13040) TaxID=521096 RepID=D5UQ54_TSUPD|nr:conserved hypothetical protein [Tsukamurella paurometabola DSM 20162]
MRTRAVAFGFAVVLGLAVILMHTGLTPAGHQMPTAGHDAPPTATAAGLQHETHAGKPSLDAVHDHQAHDCAGPVVTHSSIGSPALVAVLPYLDAGVGQEPRARAALARGPPPWTVLSLTDLCLLRI